MNAVTTKPSLSASDELLLLGSRVELPADAVSRVDELVARGVEWDYIVEASVRNGVTPLLARTLAGVAPADVAGELRALYARSAARNERILREVASISRRLAERGVQPVGLKDLYLGVAVYGDPALRPMGDVDLLIERDDYAAASRVLQELGFEPLPKGDVPFLRRYGPAQHFRRAHDDLWIDLQWRIAERAWDVYDERGFSFRVDELRRTARPMRLHDTELLVPSLEEMLLHLCLHLDGHRYAELILFTDIAELLRAEGESLDCERFVRRTRDERGESAVFFALLLAERLLDAPVPSELWDALDAPYWQGDLLQALFGELTMLHVALDELRRAKPPAHVLVDAERSVRSQAAAARAAFIELDALARRLADAGATFAIRSAGAGRRFPDPRLPAFGGIDVLVDEDDLELFDACAASLKPEVELDSREPLVAGTRLELALETVRMNVDEVIGRDASPQSNRDAALASLRAPACDDDASHRLCLTTIPLPSASLVSVLSARAEAGRLFDLPPLIDVVRRSECEVDWDALHLSPLFEWARFGPETLRRFSALRDAYYVAFSLRATRGPIGRFAYLLQSPLPRVVARVVRAGVAGRRVAARELAYWARAEGEASE